ncbi:hypothetical protein YSA_07549 [Pseudomonas putida ND6]|uniref:Uncharacterized protein n=1 Tax=Pseudomonas putida ND6 TaxID=231023 RepID=I3UZC1_PSEPU|nr:hypothetical protein YSA_07549 [Pseudomonas putida ND6]
MYHPALADRLRVPDGMLTATALCGRGLLSEAEGYRQSSDY